MGYCDRNKEVVIDDTDILYCPKCHDNKWADGNYLHQIEVNVYQGVMHTKIDGAGNVSVDRDRSGHCTDREGTHIKYACEHCENVYVLEVVGSNGNTTVSWLATPVDKNYYNNFMPMEVENDE